MVQTLHPKPNPHPHPHSRSHPPPHHRAPPPPRTCTHTLMHQHSVAQRGLLAGHQRVSRWEHVSPHNPGQLTQGSAHPLRAQSAAPNPQSDLDLPCQYRSAYCPHTCVWRRVERGETAVRAPLQCEHLIISQGWLTGLSHRAMRRMHLTSTSVAPQ